MAPTPTPTPSPPPSTFTGRLSLVQMMNPASSTQNPMAGPSTITHPNTAPTNLQAPSGPGSAASRSWPDSISQASRSWHYGPPQSSRTLPSVVRSHRGEMPSQDEGPSTGIPHARPTTAQVQRSTVVDSTGATRSIEAGSSSAAPNPIRQLSPSPPQPLRYLTWDDLDRVWSKGAWLKLLNGKGVPHPRGGTGFSTRAFAATRRHFRSDGLGVPIYPGEEHLIPRPSCMRKRPSSRRVPATTTRQRHISPVPSPPPAPLAGQDGDDNTQPIPRTSAEAEEQPQRERNNGRRHKKQRRPPRSPY